MLLLLKSNLWTKKGPADIINYSIFCIAQGSSHIIMWCSGKYPHPLLQKFQFRFILHFKLNILAFKNLHQFKISMTFSIVGMESDISWYFPFFPKPFLVYEHGVYINLFSSVKKLAGGFWMHTFQALYFNPYITLNTSVCNVALETCIKMLTIGGRSNDSWSVWPCAISCCLS